MDLRGAEKIDFGTEENTIRVRYQDGRDITYEEVEIYFPSLLREFYRLGFISRAAIIKELAQFGLKIRPSAHEPKPPADEEVNR